MGDCAADHATKIAIMAKISEVTKAIQSTFIIEDKKGKDLNELISHGQGHTTTAAYTLKFNSSFADWNRETSVDMAVQICCMGLSSQFLRIHLMNEYHIEKYKTLL